MFIKEHARRKPMISVNNHGFFGAPTYRKHEHGNIQGEQTGLYCAVELPLSDYKLYGKQLAAQ